MLRGMIKNLVPAELHGRLRHAHGKYIKRGRFALNDLDRKLEPYVDFDNGFYVELGAYDGFTQSNSYYFDLKRNWSGVLVEPTPHLFLSCVKVRGKRNKVFCNACVGFDYPNEYVEIAYANLRSLSTDLDLDLASPDEHLRSASQHGGVGQPGLTFGAKARTLDSILDESNAPATIDFLSLDVEGAELDVLKGIDFDKYTIRFMLIESRDVDRLQVFLRDAGYELAAKLSKHDYLFEKQGLE